MKMRAKTGRLGTAIAYKRYMIEADQLYRDFSISHAACERLNQLNAQQVQINSLFIESRQDEPTPKCQTNNNLTYKEQHFSIDEYLSFSNIPINTYDFSSDQQVAEHTQRTQPLSHHQKISEQSPPIKQEDSQVKKCVSEMNNWAEQDAYKMEGQSKQRIEGLVEAEGNSTEPHQIILSPAELLRKQKEYDKNILSSIAKTVRKKMFGKLRDHVAKKCKKRGISIEEFQLYCDIKKFKSNHGLASLLGSPKNASESEYQQILRPLFKKILRRAYLKSAMVEGKMKDLTAYFLFKNRFLLNFDQFQME